MKAAKFLQGLLLSVLLSACAENNLSNSLASTADSTKIYGGDKVQNTDPIAASTVLLKNTRLNELCSGVIISSKVILTAAHCVFKAQAGDIEIQFGLNGRDTHRVALEIQIYKLYIPITFMPVMNDLALVRTSEIPNNYRVASILHDDEILKSGTTVTAAGYGISMPRMNLGSGTLRKINLNVIEMDETGSVISLDQQKTGYGVCHGDSGGPSFVQTNQGMKVFGITNKISSHDKKDLKACKGRAIYTLIDKYLPWIEEVVGQWDSSARL